MAEWKKVIVSGSQAELNSLDLKGSSGNLVVEGNSTLGNTQSDRVNITGSLFVSSSKNIFTGDVTASRVYIEGGGVENVNDLFLKKYIHILPILFHGRYHHLYNNVHNSFH